MQTKKGAVILYLHNTDSYILNFQFFFLRLKQQLFAISSIKIFTGILCGFFCLFFIVVLLSKKKRFFLENWRGFTRTFSQRIFFFSFLCRFTIFDHRILARNLIFFYLFTGGMGGFTDGQNFFFFFSSWAKICRNF